MRMVIFDDVVVLHQRPLYPDGDSGKNSDEVFPFADPDHEEAADGELESVLLIGKVDNCSDDGDKRLLLENINFDHEPGIQMEN